MNLLPSLTRKHTHFNNPLSGITYDNSSFLRSSFTNDSNPEKQKVKDKTQNANVKSSNKQKHPKSFVQTLKNPIQA